MVTPESGGAPRDMPRNAARDVQRDLPREGAGGDPYRHLVEEYLAGLREITAEFERVCAERADLLRAHSAPGTAAAPAISASSAASAVPGVAGQATVPQSCGGGVRLTPAAGRVGGSGGVGAGGSGSVGVGGTAGGPGAGPGGVAPGLVGGDGRSGPGPVLS